ncbi:unnamed protein product [Pleuronectes platessa]|uniref:Uncharacterized protein n=1 Tax=Pleuronectes platessa TaxID=8262 RepID=A0A9N7V7E1_PLEPL|nr:unnamed protein product [Pleuronectes platessa]
MKRGERERVRQGGGPVPSPPTTWPRPWKSRWWRVAPPCHSGVRVSAAAIRRQVTGRFGGTVFGTGYKVEVQGGRERASSVPGADTEDLKIENQVSPWRTQIVVSYYFAITQPKVKA